MCHTILGYIVSFLFFFFKQKTAYEMRISDWSSDVCSSDLAFSQALDTVCSNPYPELKLHDRSPAAARPRTRNPLSPPGPARRPSTVPRRDKIGRASCRERVCQYV